MNTLLQDGLLDGVRRGEEAAVRRLVTAYEPYLRALVRRSMPDRLRARFDSADVVQSVWVHVMSGLRAGHWQFANEGRLRAFLFEVARRRLVSRLRRHGGPARREAGGADLDALPDRRPARPSEEAQADELWQRMLALCPAGHQQLLHLRRQGLTLDEVARRAGLHEGSVRRVFRRLARELSLRQEPLAPSRAEG
jgi:RNA polymerase sigma-70 factor (ECF subfamily)